MKNKPLYFQIWLMTTAIVTVISVACAGIMYAWAEKYFENELFAEVAAIQAEYVLQAELAEFTPLTDVNFDFESESNALPDPEDENLSEYKISSKIDATEANIQDNNKFIIAENDETEYVTIKEVKTGFIKIQNIPELDEKIYPAEMKSVEMTILDKAKQADSESITYVDIVEGQPVAVSVKNMTTPDGGGYAYTMAYDKYKPMLNELAVFIGAAILIFLCVSFVVVRLLCKKMTRGITSLSSYADMIAYQKWNEPVFIDGSSEINGLAASFEHMRSQLVKRDDEMQSMLRYISHELKTPIMVIRSYIDAAKDNIFPKGDLESTLNIMEVQALRLQEKVKDLLYITKLENSRQNHAEWKNADLSLILNDVIDNMEVYNRNIKIVKNVPDKIEMLCDSGHMTVLFENMADNMLRHAKSSVTVSVRKEDTRLSILFCNDGEPVKQDFKNKIFMPFEKGENGNVGLGLCICSKITEIYNGSIDIPDIDNGCMFVIELSDACSEQQISEDRLAVA